MLLTTILWTYLSIEMVGSKKGEIMCNSCGSTCCTSSPSNDSHCKCHNQDTHWCESPVVQKNIHNKDVCCTNTKVTTIENCDQINQYKKGLCEIHNSSCCGDKCCTYEPISCEPCCEPIKDCCTPVVCEPCCEPICCTPALYFDDLNQNTSCDRPLPPDAELCYIKVQAGRARNTCRVSCHYGEIRETIKEIPIANIYLVNHEFIDLMLDDILGCLNTQNISRTTVDRVRKYVDYYYVYYKDIELVGSLVVTGIISITDNLVTDETEANRIKAVLYALKDRLDGRICNYEQ